MDIDKLFKVPKLPTGGNKRRMPEAPTPEMLKRMKADSETSSSAIQPPQSNGASSSKGKGRATTVEEYDEENEGNASTEFAPGNDADYYTEEDNEGRFFGGGLTDEQKTILNIFDKAPGRHEDAQEDLEELSITSVRRLLLRFERAVNKNTDQRSKYPDDPSKFIDSEADLDSAIKSLLPLAQSPALAYPEFVKSDVFLKFIGLLSHENADIVIDAVEVIHELTDDDNEGDEDEDETESREEALKLLVNALLDNSILELLVDNLPRLNESEESDRLGVFHILSVFENILSVSPQISGRLVSQTAILPWLLKRIEAKAHDENRGYAAEILSILLQDSRENRLELGKQDGVDLLLRVLSQFRRRNPVDADENEFMENVFDTLCSTLNEPEIKKLFLSAEGIDLMVLMMKEKKDSSSRSIKVLDHAMTGPTGTACCETFVEALGLKTLFSAFMGKSLKKEKAKASAIASEDTTHILGIITSLFTNLASESPARIRLLAKFVEGTYEKVDRLLEIREHAEGRLKTVDHEIEQERKELVAEGEEIGDVEVDRWYLRRLDGGLFQLQTVDYILAWVAMEDDGIRSHLQQMLTRKGKSLVDIVKVLKFFHDNIEEDNEFPMDVDGAEVSPPRRQILEGLIGFLEGC